MPIAGIPAARVARLGAPALVLAALVACWPADDAPPGGNPDAALPGYEAPEGAPAFCSRLAAMTEFPRLPRAIGTLAVGVDIEARTRVSQVVRELRTVLGEVRTEGGHDGLATALDDLVRVLGVVGDGPLTDPVHGEVTAALQQVGAQAQPACGFPA